MRKIANTLWIAVVSSVVSLGSASRGVANSYGVSACSPTHSPGSWVPTNTFPASFTVGNLCGGSAIGPVDGGDQGGLYAEDILGSPANMPDDTRAGWTFTAPPGTTITAISYYRTLAAHGDRDMAAELVDANDRMLEQCTVEIPLGSPIDCSKVNNQAAASFGGLNTTSLFFGVACRVVISGAGGCAAGGTIHAARAVMYSAVVTLRDDTTPTIASVAGPLWSERNVIGIVPVTFTASDPSGIREQSVRSDTGDSLALVSSECDFTRAQPCPQQPGGSLSVDTGRVPDGSHSFTLVVSDPAGNTQTVTSPTVVVDNNGPPAPTAFAATAKGGGSNVVALAWSNPANPPAPVTGGRAQLCQATCFPATIVGSSGAAQINAPGPGTYSVRLWLLDAQGQGGPQRAASTSVTVPPAVPVTTPAKRRKLTAVLTGRQLRVRGTIVRSGRVKVSWRSKSRGHTLGAGSRVVTLRAHRLGTTFTLNARARRGTIRIAVRSGRRIVAQARVRRGA